MRVIVTGSRTWSDVDTVYDALNNFHVDSKGRLVIVHGACPTGADNIADQWAIKHHVPVARYPADWATHGRNAGPIRNAEMVHHGAHLMLAFIASCTSRRCDRIEVHGSHGATGCAELARRAGIPVRRYETRPQDAPNA